ncbi:MAG TPA: hypothetical protein VEF76_02785 [Patescibacteria group bacterium]|nr:hypothetical protein [Patescibacteria group bacterium]
MIRISPAPIVPYSPGAPMKFRRADRRATGASSDEDSDDDVLTRYLDGEIPGSVPLAPETRRHAVDFWA